MKHRGDLELLESKVVIALEQFGKLSSLLFELLWVRGQSFTVICALLLST